jgi:hypothetical protein
LGEKLAVFIKFKKETPFGLRPQDDEEPANGVILSVSEESPPLLSSSILKRL